MDPEEIAVVVSALKIMAKRDGGYDAEDILYILDDVIDTESFVAIENELDKE